MIYISNSQNFFSSFENNTISRGIPLEYMLDKGRLVNIHLNNNLQSYYVLPTVKSTANNIG